MHTWEYLVTTTFTDVAELGGEGWELVAVVPSEAGAPTHYFKRPAPSFRDRVTLDQKQRYYKLLGITPEGVKKSGILHPGLCELLASAGHTDYITVCDRGFPVPDGPRRIDLALVDDIPTVLDVLHAVAAEFALDRVLITQEMVEVSPQRVTALRALLGDIPLEVMPHVEFKHLCATAKATIRTGDVTPYANIIIVSG